MKGWSLEGGVREHESESCCFDNNWFVVFFFNDTATTEIYTLSLHDALPISNLLKHQKHRHQMPIT